MTKKIFWSILLLPDKRRKEKGILRCILTGVIFGTIAGGLIGAGTDNYYIGTGVALTILIVGFYAGEVIEAIQAKK